jgi:hypothetical protein
MEARVETGGDDGSMLDIEIDRLIGLLAGDEKQAIVSAAMILLVNLGPAAFGRLTAAMWTTEDDRLRIRTIGVLGISSLSHPEAVSILVAAWDVLVEPRARGAIRRALGATLFLLMAHERDSRREPTRLLKTSPAPVDSGSDFPDI